MKKINQYFHVSDRTAQVPRGEPGYEYDPLYKVRALVDHLKEKFPQHYHPGREINIDRKDDWHQKILCAVPEEGCTCSQGTRSKNCVWLCTLQGVFVQRPLLSTISHGITAVDM